MKNLVKVLSVVVGLVAVQPAHALVDFSLVGNLNLSNVSVNPESATSTSTKAGLGVGGLVSFDLVDSLSLETGLLLANLGYSVGDSSTAFTYLQLPLVAKYWVIPQLSINAGMYYAMGLGDVTVSTAGLSGDVTYDAANANKSDFGAVVGAGVKLPAGLFSVVGNANYLIGLSDIGKSNINTVKWTGFQLQAGISFGI